MLGKWIGGTISMSTQYVGEEVANTRHYESIWTHGTRHSSEPQKQTLQDLWKMEKKENEETILLK